MTEEVTSFDELCRRSVKEFLQTVVVVDNEASLKFDESDQQEGARLGATRGRPTSPGKKLGSSQDSDREEGEDDHERSSESENVHEERGVRDHRLELNKVSRAFAEKELTCGVYLPSEDYPEQLEALVDESVSAVLPTDASVLDWQLRKDDSQPAIEVIKKVLEVDESQGGRLRLILVYTAEELDEVSTELNEQLLDAGFTVTFNRVSDVPVLIGDHYRIAFANKPTRARVPGDDPGVVEWSKLPERVIHEFTALSRGLLRSFALQSVASVRRDMHRILAQFDEGLDPVFAGDRATKPDPDDAGRLMVEILQSEFLLSIEAGGAEREVLGAEGCIAWLAAIGSELGDREGVTLSWYGDRPNDTQINNEVREILLQDGVKDLKSDNFHAHVTRSFFGEEKADEWKVRSSDYAVLATMAYHSGERSGRPQSENPVLRFGTIIESGDKRLLCIQPACDTVRLTQTTPFLFVALPEEESDFDLVLPQGETYECLQVPVKPRFKHLREVRTLRFDPQDGEGVVIAESSNNHFLFTDADGALWAWRAQLRDITAVQLAQKAVSVIGRVGVNEFEWLRKSAK